MHTSKQKNELKYIKEKTGILRYPDNPAIGRKKGDTNTFKTLGVRFNEVFIFPGNVVTTGGVIICKVFQLVLKMKKSSDDNMTTTKFLTENPILYL